MKTECRDKKYRGKTLWAAAAEGDAKAVEILLSMGWHIDGRNRGGETALERSALNGRAQCVRLLLEKGASMACGARGRSALQAAAGRGHAECVELLAKAGADLDACDWRGGTALFEAAAIGSLECVASLIAHGCDIEKRSKDHGMTAGMMCAMVGHAGLLRLLVEAGADVGAKDANGWTARDWAKSKGRHECVEYLASQEEREALGAEVRSARHSKGALRV